MEKEEKIKVKMDDNFNLSLRGEDIGRILTALQELPFRIASPIIEKINDQLKKQLSEKKQLTQKTE